MKRILISIGAALVLIIGLIHVVFLIAGIDISPPDTKDLVPERMALPPEQNAYTYFNEATNVFYWPTNAFPLVDDYLDGSNVDAAVVEGILARNATTLEAIEKGLKCRKCFVSELTNSYTPTPYLGTWKEIGKVMALKTRHDRLAGRYAEATRTCISLLQFADMIQRDAEGILHYLVGAVLLELDLIQAQDLARDKSIPQNELTRLSEALASLGPFDRGFVRAIKVEYRGLANNVDGIRDGKFGIDDPGVAEQAMWAWKWIPSYLFQPNRTKATFANLYRTTITNASLPYASIDHQDIKEILGLKGGTAMLVSRPNVLGRMLFGCMLPALDNTLEFKCRAECNVAATRLIIACNTYERKEGKLPDSLQSLVPVYLPAVPNDPFDGKPFRYSSSKGIVYSVGKDLKDSGGSTNTPYSYAGFWRAEDAVFEINDRTGQTSL